MFGGECCGVVVYPHPGCGGVGGGDRCGGGLWLVSLVGVFGFTASGLAKGGLGVVVL